MTPAHHPRVLVEERALDSYYNILFSILEFWRHWATWPTFLTIVSHGFKRVRMVDCHCGAIGFPLERVKFVGINPPNLPPEFLAVEEVGSDAMNLATVPSTAEVSAEKAAAMKGARDVIGHWNNDPHGVGDILAGKRKARNPHGTVQLLFLSDDERQRSQVLTRRLADGREALQEGVEQPWGTLT
jgi:dihydrofolate synthase